MEDDHGSGTDSYDSGATNELDAEELAFRSKYGHGHMDDDDLDIDVYEDEPDELDHVDTDGDNVDDNQESLWNSARLRARYLADQEHGYGQAEAITSALPEDEPWPGIEDHMSDGENVDPTSEEVDIDDGVGVDEIASEASSQPSEYPSTQRAWREAGDVSNNHPQQEAEPDNGMGFKIHEDEDADIGGLDAPWN
jgi:hypothetical protein